MLTKIEISQVIDSQKERLNQLDTGLNRRLPDLEKLHNHALIITGIRRCGKSTLLQQINKNVSEPTLYLNFEDPRLAGFDISDFNRLHEILTEEGINILFFDEIQNVEKWEQFVRFRLDEGYRIFITGSNSSMLSKELGSKLTGRHVSKELFPFSFKEYIEFTGDTMSAASSLNYLLKGGFPEMIKTGLADVLMTAFNDLVIRDIAMRYNIRNTTILQQMAVWLLSNTGKTITGNSLRKLFSIGSSSSIMEYLSHFEDTYLFFYIPKFSYSQKVQLVNPKKIYSIDTGMIVTNSLSFSNDYGRLLENMMYMHLRRFASQIFYFSEKRECDFVVFDRKKMLGLYQVCWQLNRDNLNREIEGLSEAMDFFKAKEATIITYDQTDTFTLEGKKISAVPFYEWAGRI